MYEKLHIENHITTHKNESIPYENDAYQLSVHSVIPNVNEINWEKSKRTREEYISILHTYFIEMLYPQNETTIAYAYKIC